ncbi:MAG: hypothetical protein WC408_03675 [Candidatus Micrarchaeia archaeon]|jgi:hypothetical protein
MKRGQAFDTMMLVISVIVAVAILGMLLGFLGGIGSFGAKYSDVIPDLVKKINTQGVGITLQEKVEFSVGGMNPFVAQNAIGTAPISSDNVKFSCVSGDNLCGTDNPLDVEDGSIMINQKITATVAVCYNDQKSTTYHIIIGSVTKNVRNAAMTLCDLG